MSEFVGGLVLIFLKDLFIGMEVRIVGFFILGRIYFNRCNNGGFVVVEGRGIFFFL